MLFTTEEGQNSTKYTAYLMHFFFFQMSAKNLSSTERMKKSQPQDYIMYHKPACKNNTTPSKALTQSLYKYCSYFVIYLYLQASGAGEH